MSPPAALSAIRLAIAARRADHPERVAVLDLCVKVSSQRFGGEQRPVDRRGNTWVLIHSAAVELEFQNVSPRIITDCRQATPCRWRMPSRFPSGTESKACCCWSPYSAPNGC